MACFLGGLLLLIVDKSTERLDSNVTPTARYASNNGQWWWDKMAFPEIHSPWVTMPVPKVGQRLPVSSILVPESFGIRGGGLAGPQPWLGDPQSFGASVDWS